MIIAVVDDLLFGSKIRSAADAAGTAIRFVRRGDDLSSALSEEDSSLMLVDLSSTGAADAIRLARATVGPAVAIVAFASHVRADLIADARAAGADRVLARSAFVAELPALVASPPTPRPS